ncbi:hypothetical protein BVC71_15145 [Marivivens niveibacter]|uniref:Uncharacterized protein n=1 Tax=Marivivens niveibacter TaxID=1930667 RepID=A0A251WUH7_9RHOB|nr:hypothetical protein BVC71_15145 [Marivivens niveibacter]
MKYVNYYSDQTADQTKLGGHNPKNAHFLALRPLSKHFQTQSPDIRKAPIGRPWIGHQKEQTLSAAY